MTQVTLKGSPVRLIGKFPQVGEKVPNFQLVDGDLKDHTLKDYIGKRKLLSIVPSLDTPVCSLSAKKFNTALTSYPEVICLVISADLPFAQKRVCGAENASHIIPLSMMRSKQFAEDYGVLIADGPLAGLCTRAVLVLDENNTILYTELVSEITREPNYDKALASL